MDGERFSFYAQARALRGLGFSEGDGISKLGDGVGAARLVVASKDRSQNRAGAERISFDQTPDER